MLAKEEKCLRPATQDLLGDWLHCVSNSGLLTEFNQWIDASYCAVCLLNLCAGASVMPTIIR